MPYCTSTTHCSKECGSARKWFSCQLLSRSRGVCTRSCSVQCCPEVWQSTEKVSLAIAP